MMRLMMALVNGEFEEVGFRRDDPIPAPCLLASTN